MSISVHICKDDKIADEIIETEKNDTGNPNLVAEKLHFPDVVVFDHSADPQHPQVLNRGKVCVIFGK